MYIKSIITAVAILFGFGSQSVFAMQKGINVTFFPEIRVEVAKNSSKDIVVFDQASPFNLIEIPAPAEHGQVNIRNVKIIRYTPNRDFVGRDQILYEASNDKIEQLGIIYITVLDQGVQQRPLPVIPVQKGREEIGMGKPTESMDIPELEAAISQMQKRLKQLTIVGGNKKFSKEVQEQIDKLTQQITNYEKALNVRMKEIPQKKQKISVGQEGSIVPQGYQRGQSLSPDLMKQIREGKQLKSNENAFQGAQLSPSQKQKWQAMNADQLDTEFDRLNRELIRLRLSSPGASKELPKEKVDRINQLDVDLNFIRNRLRELEQ